MLNRNIVRKYQTLLLLVFRIVRTLDTTSSSAITTTIPTPTSTCQFDAGSSSPTSTCQFDAGSSSPTSTCQFDASSRTCQFASSRTCQFDATSAITNPITTRKDSEYWNMLLLLLFVIKFDNGVETRVSVDLDTQKKGQEYQLI